MNDATLPSDNALRFKKNWSENDSAKMKRIDNKIEQNKVQYKLDRKGAKISA